MSKYQPTAIDLFAGAGGFSLAARKIGFKLLAAVEIDKEACETYELNFIKGKQNKAKLYQQDILTELTPKKLKSDLELESGRLDLLMGGPPCQGFSSHRINSAGVNDPRNQLLLQYFEYVKELRPKVFLVENVTGMLWKRHEDYVEKFKALAKKHNYELFGPQILNAQDYGVPQNRKRVFILGVDKDLGKQDVRWPPEPTHGTPTGLPFVTASTVFDKPSNKTLKELKDVLKNEYLASSENHITAKLKEANEKIDQDVNNLIFLSAPLDSYSCNTKMNTTDKLAEKLKHIRINGDRTQLPEHLVLKCHKKHKGHKDVYGRIRLVQPSNTITTGCNNLSKGRFTHPWKHHGITIREAACLQSFPKDFTFLGNQTSQAKQVGNAVPIDLGIALIKHIKKTIL